MAAQRDVVDDATDGIGSIQRALLTAQHFHLRDVIGDERREVELTRHGIARLDAVDHHERVVRLGAADAHLREAAERARAVDGYARHVAQDVRHVSCLALLEILGTKNGEGRAEQIRAHALVGACRRDDDVFERIVGALGQRRNGSQQRRDARGDERDLVHCVPLAKAMKTVNSRYLARREIPRPRAHLARGMSERAGRSTDS